METANLKKANQVRREKAINKLYRFNDYGVKSFKQLIDANTFIKAETELIPELKYNRVKFNRMTDQTEQDEYYRRSTEKTKEAYFLYYDETTSTQCSKYVYDYFLENELKEKCAECKKPMTDLEHNYGTEDILCCIRCFNEAQQVQQMLIL